MRVLHNKDLHWGQNWGPSVHEKDQMVWAVTVDGPRLGLYNFSGSGFGFVSSSALRLRIAGFGVCVLLRPPSS